MSIAQQIFSLLKKGPLTSREIQECLPNVPIASISAIVTMKKDLFIRLRDRLIGLKGKHDHLLPIQIVQKRKKKIARQHKQLAIYQRLVNYLVCGPMRIKNLIALMSDVKESSIQVEISKHPELFIRVRKDLIGRKGRDEWLADSSSL